MWIPGCWGQYVDVLWFFQFLCGWLAGGKIGECTMQSKRNLKISFLEYDSMMLLCRSGYMNLGTSLIWIPASLSINGGNRL